MMVIQWKLLSSLPLPLFLYLSVERPAITNYLLYAYDLCVQIFLVAIQLSTLYLWFNKWNEIRIRNLVFRWFFTNQLPFWAANIKKTTFIQLTKLSQFNICSYLLSLVSSILSFSFASFALELSIHDSNMQMHPTIKSAWNCNEW